MYGTLKQKTVDLGSKGSFEERPGALHRALGIALDKRIPEKELEGHHTGKLGRMIASAKGLKSMHRVK